MPFISIQLNSNRPEQITLFFDSIESTADAPHDIEVLLHIDEDDTIMEAAVAMEMQRRKFTLRMLKTNLVTSYATLWMPLNPLFKMTHPDVYFVINLSDEILFETKGWDSIIRRYVGYYPDHIFRLRASKYRFRNYTDIWECGYAPDSVAFYTRRWLELNGDWNPCLGPDSFQQCVSFYLFTSDPFSHEQYYRDIPLTELRFTGEGASIGLQGEAKWRRVLINMRAWFTLMSHRMQQEAKRRAMRMKAAIIADTYKQTQAITIIENQPLRRFTLCNAQTGEVREEFSYKLSWWSITIKNILRMPNVLYYSGGNSRIRKKSESLLIVFMSCALLFFVFVPVKNGPAILNRIPKLIHRIGLAKRFLFQRSG